MPKQPGAENGIQLVRRMAEEIGLEPREHRLQQEDEQQRDAEHRQRGDAAAADDLVDDDLRHERHGDAEELQKKPGQQDFREIRPVALPYLVEPGQVVFLLEIFPAPAHGECQDLPRPDFGKLHRRQCQRLRQGRIDEEHDSLMGQGQDAIVAIRQLNDGRHWQVFQLVNTDREQLRFQRIFSSCSCQTIPVQFCISRAGYLLSCFTQSIILQNLSQSSSAGIYYLFFHKDSPMIISIINFLRSYRLKTIYYLSNIQIIKMEFTFLYVLSPFI